MLLGQSFLTGHGQPKLSIIFHARFNAVLVYVVAEIFVVGEQVVEIVGMVVQVGLHEGVPSQAPLRV